VSAQPDVRCGYPGCTWTCSGPGAATAYDIHVLTEHNTDEMGF